MGRWFVPLGVFVAALIGCTSGSHHKACDEPALERAVARFEAAPGSDAAVRELIEGLRGACPSVHSGLIRDLELSYLGGEPNEKLLLLSDRDYLAERDKACVDPQARSERVAKLPPNERARASFEICELGRFALLEPGEPILEQDLAAFWANDWLMRHGVETSLGRRLARGLMFVSADEPLSLHRCVRDPGSPACATVLRKRGAGLPTSSADLRSKPGSDATLVFLIRGVNVVDSRPVGGDVTLRSLLAEEAAAQAQRGAQWSRSLVIVGDRGTPWAEVDAVLHVASEYGWTDFALLVERGDELTQLPIRLGRRGSASDDSRPLFAIDGWGIVILPDDAGDVGDLHELEAFVRRRTDPWRGPGGTAHHYARVAAAVDVELQTVVTVIDALRGRECSLTRVFDEEVLGPTEDCSLWDVTVELRAVRSLQVCGVG